MEETFLTQIMFQFNSEKSEGKFYRLGTNKEMNDAIYRVSSNIEFEGLTKEEKQELINQNSLLSSRYSHNTQEFISKVLEYTNV